MLFVGLSQQAVSCHSFLAFGTADAPATMED